jgi:uncharacterized membrane protein
MKKFISFLLIVSLVVIAGTVVNAQCAMCTGQVETSTNAGSSVALGINKGVLYIFMMPYLVIGTLLYFWWRGGRKNKQAEAQQQ